MNSKEIYMTQDWTAVLIITIILIVATITFLLIVILFIIHYKRKTDEHLENLTNRKSELIINTKTKIVEKRIIDNNGMESKIESYALDDFIYMLSLNPETKNFRELLKLINNDESKAKILAKYKSITTSKMLLKLTYSDVKYSFASAIINLDQNIEDGLIQLQLKESFAIVKKKETIPEIFNEKIEYLDDNKLFKAILKEVKAIKTKGWTIIKIINKNSNLNTEKDFYSNVIQLLRIRSLLKDENSSTFFDLDGNLFIVKTSGRSSNHFSINKAWNNKMNDLFSAKTKQNYLDVIMEDWNVITVNDIVKDQKSVNLALIKLRKLSKLSNQERNSKKLFDKINFESLEIHEKANSLYKLASDEKLPIRLSDFEIKERTVKGVIEYYIDMEASILGDVINNTYLFKKEIIIEALKIANKKAGKEPTKICTTMIELSIVPLLAGEFEPSDWKENFFISISENREEGCPKYKYHSYIQTLKEEGCKFIQLIRDVEDGSLNLLRKLEPEYILYTKDFSKVADPEEKIRINLTKINSVKHKNTKIINIK